MLFRIDGLPSISALKFDGALNMAVGTSTGQVDLTSSTTVLRDPLLAVASPSLSYTECTCCNVNRY